MDDEEYTEFATQIRADVLDKIDFKSGVLQEISKDKKEMGCILDVRWKRNVHLVLYISKWNRTGWYYAERNGDKVSCSHYNSKNDDNFFASVQHFVNEIENGDFDHKKTISEQIADIIQKRQLTNCMNNTKWKEFVHVMDEEMSIKIPYDYKTLFEERREDDLLFGTAYDIESFNGYHFKSVEWVKVKPKFYERRHRGRLIEDEKIYHDLEKEFLGLMDKYSIPYEYDEKTEIYTIYGYK